MHRHFLRSALSQCSESGVSIQTTQRLSFSTSSARAVSTPPPIPPSTRIVNPKNPKIRRHVYRNPAGVDQGYTQNERLDITQPTPVLFINPNPIKNMLLEKQKKAYVAGEQAVGQHGDSVSEDELTLPIRFTPGSFVEIRRNERSIEAIVLTDILFEGVLKTICLTSSGDIMAVLPTNIYFTVPNVVSADLIKRCGVEEVPETPQALSARVEALKQLRAVSIQAQQAAEGSRMWDRQKMFRVYEEIKHPDPTQWATVTLDHVTALFYVDPGYVNYYATHKYLMDRPLKYVADTGYIRNQTFRVRPERDVKEIQMVDEWITQHRLRKSVPGPYRAFVSKARELVARYKEHPPRNTGPMSQEQGSHIWNENDRVILSYLLRSLQQHQSNQLDPYQMGRNTILKDIDIVSEVTDSAIHNLLIQLNVIAPWQDLHVLTPLLNPSTDFGIKSPVEKEAERIYKSSSQPKPTAGMVLGPLDLLPSDPLDSVRHDFGDLKAFVIDDPSAKELDDGISLERIPTEPDNYWVHVHIADPARCLPPGHALSHMARKQFSSVYLTTSNFPMLPNVFMHDTKFGLSLTDTSISKQSNHVLTFSMKMDGEANILDYKLRAGILRNVRKTSYSDVDFALGLPVPERILPFGGSLPEPQRGPPLPADEIDDLRILKKLSEDQVNKRIQSRVLSLNSESVRMEVTRPPSDIESPVLHGGAKFHGFPDMTYTVTSPSHEDSGARSLVSEMMKLACRVASRVASDHNIPFIRRALRPFAWKSEADLEEALKMANGTGVLPAQEFVKFGTFLNSGYFTQSCDGHSLLGLSDGEGYSRTTSPLRRYTDLAAHWQLHHILLGPNAPARPPISSDEMEQLILEATIKDIQLRRLERANHTFYALMYIKRLADEATKRGSSKLSPSHPLARMRAFTIRRPTKDDSSALGAQVALPDLGIQAQLIDMPPHFSDIPSGTDLVVRLKNIHLGLRRMKMFVTLVQD